MTNYYFLQICFIYYLYNFILQSSLHLKTYMSTRKWSDYISRGSAKPALPWLTSLETNVWVLFMRSQAVAAVGGRGKLLSWELLFQAKVEGHGIYTRACWQCALQHPLSMSSKSPHPGASVGGSCRRLPRFKPFLPKRLHFRTQMTKYSLGSLLVPGNNNNIIIIIIIINPFANLGETVLS